MKRRYRISPKDAQRSMTEAEIARYRDPKRLLYNYHQAIRKPRVPLYKNPKAFIALLFIVLLAILLTEVAEDRNDHKSPPPAPAENLDE